MRLLLVSALLGGIAFDSTAQTALPPVTTIRSASYYLYTVQPPDTRARAVSPEEMLANEQIDFPQMRKYGFNTVWLVEFRSKFDPNLDNHYDANGLANFRAELETARQNGLRVMVGLNYGSGFQVVTGREGTTAIHAKAQFDSWLSFVSYLLAGIDDYREMVYPVVFEEGQISAEFDPFGEPDAVALALRETIGNLPALLAPEVRARWQFGWYGATTAFYGHTRSMRGYDWVGQGYYTFDESIRLTWLPDSAKGLSDDQIENAMEFMFDKVEALYPGLPIVITESGYYTCDSTRFSRAADVYALYTRFARARGYGLNLWGYRTLLTPEQECAERRGKGGHSLCNPDGSPRPAMLAVSESFKEDGKLRGVIGSLQRGEIAGTRP